MAKVIGCIKCVYAVSVLALWIFSIIILVLATVIRDNLSSVALVTEGTGIGDFYLKTFFPVIFPILITVSCFLFVIGCVGCCGVFTNSQTLLGWFFFTLLVTFCVELSAGVWRIIEYDLGYNETDLVQLQKNIDLYTSGDHIPMWFKDAWTDIHRKFNCCGVESYKDWISKDLEILLSCCSPSGYPKGAWALILPGIPGCGRDILYYLNTSKYINAMPYITGIMGLLQVLAMVLTLKIWLVHCLEAKEKTADYSHRAPEQCFNDEKQFYQIEMENKNGTTCYLTPLMSYKDTRVCEYPAFRDMTSHTGCHRTSTEPNGSDDVIGIPGPICSSTNHPTRAGTRTRSQRHNAALIKVQSLPRQATTKASGVKSQTGVCTCSLGRTRDKTVARTTKTVEEKHQERHLANGLQHNNVHQQALGSKGLIHIVAANSRSTSSLRLSPNIDTNQNINLIRENNSLNSNKSLINSSPNLEIENGSQTSRKYSKR